MLHKLERVDPILNTPPFTQAEVSYNLLHRICGDAEVLGWKSTDGNMIFAQTPGHRAWLWIYDSVEGPERNRYISELIDALRGISIPGICSGPETAERFAAAYSKDRRCMFRTHMAMEAYYCPKVIRPLNVNGTMRRASRQDAETVAGFLANFSTDAYGVRSEPSVQRLAAERMIDAGNLCLWLVNGIPVSMANIAHRSARHARINSVFTSPRHRKNGYASALVAELCAVIRSEYLVPILYADLKNPDSNKLYAGIGFVGCGKIADLKFT
ncbi:GNAT family N-acetyltransferase [Paenibacillus allorhizosphaerae]|uniref:N-acetyltransferase domain-containing protein n=1 Tax=Paenibacillus allorhizosphaerae TaxID=2849866 RepID=A0ABN7TP46_9BACL|nr:GNAT family N-acetyltransferase [Paenibacillus allorhizosphaerae]CAG7644483.1 hypothetical protein PAECIP111802_03281 [Paenibacillus allorhizosphaerae]